MNRSEIAYKKEVWMRQFLENNKDNKRKGFNE